MIRNFGAVQGIKGQPQGLLLGQGTGGTAQIGDVVSGQTFTNDLGQQTGNGANAKRWANGSGVSSAGTLTFTTDTSTNTQYYVTVTGLNFTPSSVIVQFKEGTVWKDTTLSPTQLPSTTNSDTKISIGSNTQCFRLTGNAYVNSSGFQLPINTQTSASLSFNWIAFE